MIGITILGATGSIGLNTLDVISRHPHKFRVIALTANENVEQLFKQCIQHRPLYAVMRNNHAAEKLQALLQEAQIKVTVLAGESALVQVASLPEVDYVMAAIVGAVGLLPTLAAVRAGKRVLLANKEALVMAGALFIEEVRRSNAQLIPVDSEHNAIFQCMPNGFIPGISAHGVKRILLTASGGPFHQASSEQLQRVTPNEACAHPNWSMGRKISVDSATMMNKGLEVIEAHWLFGLPLSQIEVVIHPQSVIHSLVEYEDGSLLAQLGRPDMRTPIANALAWPERIAAGVDSLDLLAVGKLDFMPVRTEHYPCLHLAYEAIAKGGTATTILNAANEVAVHAFLHEQLAFMDIYTIVSHVMNEVPSRPAHELAIILADDQCARMQATQLIMKKNAFLQSNKTGKAKRENDTVIKFLT